MIRPLKQRLVAGARVATATAILAWPGCTSSTDSGVPASLELTPGAVTVRQGEAVQVVATVRDSTGATIGAPVTFLSSDEAIARVSASGLVTGVAGGPALIVAISGLVRDTAAVTVLGHPAGTATSLNRAGGPHRVAVSNAGVAYVTNPATGETGRIDLPAAQFSGSVPVGNVPTDLTFSANGATAYVSAQSAQTIYVIDVGTNTLSDSIRMRGDPVPVRITQDGQKLFIATNVDSLFVVALPAKTVLKTFALPATSHWMAWHPNGRLLYLATRDGGTVIEFDTQTNALLRTLTLGGRTQGMAVSSDGSELYVADEFGGLEIWNLAAGSRITEVTLSGGGFGVALSPDDAVIYVTVPSTGSVHIVNRGTRAVVQTLITGGTPRGVAFDGYGRFALVANEGGWVTVVR